MAGEGFRNEIKHRINLYDSIMLRKRLKAVLKIDRYARADGTYRVRSLYFDNADDKALREKYNGLNHREKFRIRYYNEDTNFLRLEKKSKDNGLCQKISVPLKKEECIQLLHGDTTWMPSSEKALVLELYAKMKSQQLRPRTVVDYQREAFFHAAGNVRLTIDSDLRTGICAIDFLSRDLPIVRTEPEVLALLEVKYDEFLPDFIADLVQVQNRMSAPFSKYTACRIYG